jgi:hypothetical protein
MLASARDQHRSLEPPGIQWVESVAYNDAALPFFAASLLPPKIHHHIMVAPCLIIARLPGAISLPAP